jgi:hypothetical protein
MKSRLGYNKPDQAIKMGVMQARQGARGAKRAQALVVAASLVVTLAGWGLFSRAESQTSSVAQAPAPAAIVVSTEQTASASPIAAAAMQADSANQAISADSVQASSAGQATPAVITTTSQIVVPTITPAPVAKTGTAATQQDVAYSEREDEGEFDDIRTEK